MGRHFGDSAKHNSKDDHREERPKNCPDDADSGLLIAHADISPSEDIEQLAVAPDVTPVVLLGATRFDQNFRAWQ
jgi:hypothetical protein